MCGIAGIWRFKKKVEQDEIKSFTDSMTHRGPDGAGYEIFESDNLALGHRRLSILDLTLAGKQPMSYADQRYWLTFNGEIYNFIEVKNTLIEKGYQFISETDSEVVLASYIEWGLKCFEKFNGMWAIAIWDSQQKELILCRDRFGVKPLHFAFIPNELFAFASETIAFKYLKDFKRTYHHKNLVRAMHAHNVLEPAGQTIYQNVFQLLPGNFMRVKGNKIVEQGAWWKTLEHLPLVPKNFEEQKEEFLHLLSDACKIRLRSDVSIASALSGGVDSTAVYCMLTHVMKSNGDARVAKDWQKAFSIAFPGSDVDERKYIESVLKQTNGKGIIIEPTNENIIQELEKSTAQSDFISGTPLSSLTYVYKAMHENGIVVSMDGHGVDEYLYGYHSSVESALTNAYTNNDKEYAQVLERTLQDMCFENQGQRYIDRARVYSHQITEQRNGGMNKIKHLIKRVVRKNQEQSHYLIPKLKGSNFFTNEIIDQETFHDVYSVYGKNTNLGEQLLLEEFHYKDLPYNLRDFDRGAMQHQIEIRMPFLDYRLVTYAMALPQKSKLNNGFTKYILRESLKGIMPEDIRTRKLKIGLGAPLADWFNGPLNDYILDLSNSRKLKESGFLNGDFVKKQVQENCTKKSWNDHTARSMWPIINYLLLNE